MSDRERALEEIVAIARRHDVDAAEIAAALGSPAADTASGRWRGIVVRVLGFLGGTFVFAGVGVFIALHWDDLNVAARIVVTLGSGIAAFLLAVLAARDPRFDKASTPLFLAAGALEPTGMLVAFYELGTGGDWHGASLATAGAMALQFGLAFRSLGRGTLLFGAILFGSCFALTAFDLFDVDGTVVALLMGGALVAIAVAVDRTRHHDITAPWHLIGALAFLWGVFDVVESTSFELTFLAVAAGFVSLSVAVHSRTLLFVATLALLAYTGWFTSEHFVDSVGWPLALVAFGLFMIGLSALAFRIDRDYVRTDAAPPPAPTSRSSRPA